MNNPSQDRMAIEIDEFERGYPRLTLPLIMDVAGACLAVVAKTDVTPYSHHFQSDEARQKLVQRVHEANIPQSAVSWKALIGKLGRLNRIKVFDPRTGEKPIHYQDLLRPGVVSIIDLSDSGASELNNIVIADLLMGLQDARDTEFAAYEQAKRAGQSAVPPTPVLLVIEEAHEFLSAERITRMPTLFQQLARLAKRGRKRWLGLVFVTQLPQHLPAQVLGLVNSFALHKINDAGVISTLRKTISGIDDGLWTRLPGLAPGQAIVSFPHMTRPLLVSIDPTPTKLRLVD